MCVVFEEDMTVIHYLLKIKTKNVAINIIKCIGRKMSSTQKIFCSKITQKETAQTPKARD